MLLCDVQISVVNFVNTEIPLVATMANSQNSLETLSPKKQVINEQKKRQQSTSTNIFTPQYLIQGGSGWISLLLRSTVCVFYEHFTKLLNDLFNPSTACSTKWQSTFQKCSFKNIDCVCYSPRAISNRKKKTFFIDFFFFFFLVGLFRG